MKKSIALLLAVMLIFSLAARSLNPIWLWEKNMESQKKKRWKL